MQRLDKRKDIHLDRFISGTCGLVPENGPPEIVSPYLALSELHSFRKKTLMRDAEDDAFLFLARIHLIKVMDEHQIGYLFNDVQRIGESTRPELRP